MPLAPLTILVHTGALPAPQPYRFAVRSPLSAPWQVAWHAHLSPRALLAHLLCGRSCTLRVAEVGDVPMVAQWCLRYGGGHMAFLPVCVEREQEQEQACLSAWAGAHGMAWSAKQSMREPAMLY